MPEGAMLTSIEPFGFVHDVLSAGLAAIEKLLLVFEIENVSDIEQPLIDVTVIM
jgi:hypothetical protein